MWKIFKKTIFILIFKSTFTLFNKRQLIALFCALIMAVLPIHLIIGEPVKLFNRLDLLGKSRYFLKLWSMQFFQIFIHRLNILLKQMFHHCPVWTKVLLYKTSNKTFYTACTFLIHYFAVIWMIQQLNAHSAELLFV